MLLKSFYNWCFIIYNYGISFSAFYIVILNNYLKLYLQKKCTNDDLFELMLLYLLILDQRP